MSTPEKRKEMSADIPGDIRQRVACDFGEQHADEVFHYLLERIPDGLANGTRPRHLRCVLYLANGDREQLERYIDMCLMDTRDVMLAAEYEGTDEHSTPIPTRDFNKPFNQTE